MSKIDGKDPLQVPSYDYSVEETQDVAAAIKIFNSYKDAFDSSESAEGFAHKIDSNCSEFAGLCEYLLNQTPNQVPAEQSSVDNGDLIDLLLVHMTSIEENSTKDCLKTLHQVGKVLTNNGIIDKVNDTFQKSQVI